MVGWSDVDVAVFHLSRQWTIWNVGGHCLGFGDLLGFQAIAVKHVFEVHVAADVELHGAIYANATFFKKACEDTVGDGCTDLGFDVIANNGDASVSELLSPLRVGGDEYWESVDKGAACIDGGLCVEFVGFFGAHWEVGHQNIGFCVDKRLDNVDWLGGGLVDGRAVMIAQAVESRATQHVDAGLWDIGDFDSAVL